MKTNLFIKTLLKSLMTGLDVPQEYACVALESFTRPPTVSLICGRQSERVADVTHSHIFLGYKPVIIALFFQTNAPEFDQIKDESIRLEFNQIGFDNKKKCIASLSLRQINAHTHEGIAVLFYEGSRGAHKYLSSLHQLINRQLEKIKIRKPGNVGLPGNLADQVRIAYSLPRLISIITVSDGTLMNMFPTDLHGTAGEEIYIGSLREGGSANEQVQRLKKIVISEVSPSWYRQAYALGKNHMKGLTAESNFSLHKERSQSFGFPLPEGVIKYRELALMHSWQHGIHWIHHYKIVNQKQVASSPSTLAHIHQYYAQWRKSNNIKTEYLWR